jgi:hypothetical protein
MTFISRAQILSGLVAVLLALLVLELVRRRKLSEEYSVLWLVSMVAVAIAAFATPLLRWITHAFGILYEASTVFFFGLVFVVLVLLHLSVKLSRLGRDAHVLAQEVALLRAELERGPGAATGAERS